MANDVDAIRAVHDAWFAANVNLDGEAMLPTLSTSDQYLQFNLNGLVYNGAQEKYKLWKHLIAAGINITRIEDVTEPRIEVFGDTALLTSEGLAWLEVPTPSGKIESSGATRFRNTEFHRRDDGNGNPEWRIWHMHISESAPEGSPKFVTE
ncbi:MAG TPA: nuclear transport factor 2 family protein [Pseudonocardia sp.]|jgi:ketosteroid isomerase-like protein|nr:nuclear transport factor 2 family protein [Pseudonocardia sp.]